MPIEIDIRENAFYKEGEVQGETRGEARGEVRGRLLAVIELRFGTLPAGIRQHVNEATIEQLEHWLELARTAGTLGAVFSN